jgi:hypothetical protein
MYALLNVVNTAAVRDVIKSLALTAIIVCSFIIVTAVTPFIVAALAAVLATVAHVVAATLAIVAHAALFALACAVRAAVLVALCRALPVVVRVLWRMAVAVYRHRDGLLIAAKGICFAAVVVCVFVVALVWTPVVLAACCTVLPQTSIATIVLGGAVATVKGM